MAISGLKLSCAWAALLVIASVSLGQQAVYTPIGTLLPKGRLTVRSRFEFRRYLNDPTPARRELHECQVITDLDYGLGEDVALGLQLPAMMREEGSWATGQMRKDSGLGDITLTTRWSLWQNRNSPDDRFVIRHPPVAG